MSAEGFAAVPNWMIRDESIGLYALTVYGALASHTGPGGIHPSQATIAREARCSERQVRIALNELETLGVVERVRRKDSRGRASNGYVLHPHGRLAEDEELVETVKAQGAGTSEVAAHGAGGSGTGAHLVPLIEEEPTKKSPPIVPRGDGRTPEQLFEDVWRHWPRKDNKKKALEKFVRLKNQAEVAAAIVSHGAAHARFSGPYVPHLVTWLNGERWNDPLPGPRGGVEKRSTVDVGRDADAILRERELARGRQAVTA